MRLVHRVALDELPRIAADLLAEWDLTLDGSSIHGHCALVLPVRTTSARPAVLKIGFRDVESEHEHLALQRWHGVGAVELLRADPHRGAQLLERLHHQDLRDADEIEACEIVAELYRRVVVRMVLNAHWCLEDAARPGHGLTDEDKVWITECITIAKAVQD